MVCIKKLYNRVLKNTDEEMKKIEIVCVIVLLFSACMPEKTDFQTGLEIHDIQGCSHLSPYEGKEVNRIIGVVTHKTSNGFMMQSVKPDDLTCTSEGIFVFTKNYADVMVTDLVSVSGLVDEFFDGKAEEQNLSQTEIIQPKFSIIQSEYEIPDPIILDDFIENIPKNIIENDQMTKFDPSEDGLDFYESLESMLVEIRNGIVVAPRNNYGEIVVLPETFVNSNSISTQGALLSTKEDFNPEKVMIKLPSIFDQPVNVGDKINNPLIGVMDYSYGNFKILEVSPIEISNTENGIDPFKLISKGLTIATYNLENLSPMDGPKKFSGIARQIVKNLQSPDVLVLNEVMDNSGSMDDGVASANETIQYLVESIQKNGGPAYSFSDTSPKNNQDGGILGGNIRTVLLYREDQGISLEENSSSINGIKFINNHFSIEQNPILIGEFSSSFDGSRKPRIWLLNQNGQQFFVAGVHLVSQSANNPDWGNQQPPQKPEEFQRVEQAELISQKLSQILNLNPNVPLFIAGDLNDMPWSGTIRTLSKDIFVNSINLDTPAENYSFIFEGNAQQLDYIFVNKNLVGNVVQTRFVHLNSFLDQNNSISDHDPLIIEFSLN